MTMFMYIYRICISVLLLLVHCEVTVEQATRGPLHKICTTTWYNTSIPPPLAKEDEHVINELLGCTWGILRPSCDMGSSSVTCDCYVENHIRCRVVYIDFSNRRLEGRIPEDIGNLTYLKRLSLNGNKLRGSIPNSTQQLGSLLEFSLCDNSLDGKIPPFLGQMKYIEKISLCRNFFNETIPQELGSLQHLEILDLRNNFLSGKIPDQLGNIKSLIELYLGDNQLSDKLPEHLGNLVNLQELDLQSNEFIDALPQSFKSLKKLTYFNVRGNNLNYTIPDIFSEWKYLRIMNLMGNNFSGPLHGQFSKLKSLTTLYVSDLVGGNSSFPNLSEVKYLNALTLRNCSINSSIPEWIWKLRYLKYLDLSFNHLYGAIPEDNNKLTYLFLRKNKLNETIPSWMNATKYVDVSENSFKNVNISSKKAINPNLNLFKCCSNESDEVAKRHQVDLHCKNGTLLYDHLFINCGGDSVSANGSEYEADLNKRGESTFFKSSSSKWGYSSMGRFLWANRNNYKLNDTCRIHAGDAQLYRTARLSPISLKYYGFCLKTGWYNVYLHFADISSSNNRVSHSKAGRLFDVFIQGDQVRRNFSIETEAEGMNTRTTMEHTAFVQDNLLEIHLYWSGKGSSLYPSVYYGPLISAITVAPVQSGLSPGVLGGLSAFALLSLILFIGFSWRYHDKLLEEEQELVELYPEGLYNYRKIEAATNNFNPENRLGEGGFGIVYKGTLSNGTAVAVKKLSGKKEGMCEFAEKSRAISGIKHPNLVTLMGCCAGKNQLLLIYEYAGNISLEDALFGSDELRARLDWPTRYRICLGLAEGLSFLHERSKHVVIHGDIKPANILDDDLEGSKHVIIHGDIKPANILHDDDLEGSKHVIIHGDIKPANIPVDDDLEGSKHVIIHGDIKPANIPVDGDLEGSKRVIIYGDIKPANILLDDDLEGSKRVIIHGDMKPAKFLLDDDLEGSKHIIIHGDIKPANILLDDNLNPKIYDFGFAKLYHKQKSEGTRSYTAPEVKDRPLRANADVYSFGVVMLILVSGMNIKTPIAGGEYEYLVEEAETKNRSGALMELVDPSLGREYDREEANVILRLAIQCIDLPRFRPTMTKIVKILKKQEPIETILIKSEGD